MAVLHLASNALLVLVAHLVASVNWPEVTNALGWALAVVGYLAKGGLVVVAIKFSWQVSKAIHGFLGKQEELARMAQGIAADAKMFADRVTTILELHDDWLNDHHTQLAVINDRLGIAPDDQPHRRHTQRRKSDRAIPPDDRTDDAPGAD